MATTEDMSDVFRLRHSVFHIEYRGEVATPAAIGYDVDCYDEICDHIVVTSRDEIVGTYRLLPLERLARAGLPCYAQSEFAMEEFFQGETLAGVLELGRSCIHPSHRNGSVIRLLWAAIAHYIAATQSRFLFGCVSIHGQGISSSHALHLRDEFKSTGLWHPRFDFPVQEKFRTYGGGHGSVTPLPSGLGNHPQHVSTQNSPYPPLLKGYLNLGAKVCGGPAHDRELHCYDFLMLLDATIVPPRYLDMLIQCAARNRFSVKGSTLRR